MRPPFLQKNDEVRIISPSGVVQAECIEGASLRLKSWGLKVTEGRFARKAYGRFAGTQEERIGDLQAALDAPEVKAIFCARGGYGLVQIIDKIDFSSFLKSPKWIVGFSDITVLHNAISALSISSIHGAMAREMSELPPTADSLVRLKEILFGQVPRYTIESHLLNRPGVVRAPLIGGNLSIIANLRASAFDLNFENKILFLEEVGEEPYHIDRMIQNFRLGGVFSKISGLIVGQFSDCNEDPLMGKTVYELFADAVKEYRFPVCFNFPAGHISENFPLLLSRELELKVGKNEVNLSFL